GRESMGAHEILPPPAGVEEATICALSGMRANAWCPSRAREWVATGDEALPCAWHHRSDEGLLTIYPAEFRAWAGDLPGASARRRGPDAAASRPVAGDRPIGRPADGISIANPPAGAIYSVDP